MTGVQLDEIIAASSQVLASALALPLFKAGVYLGQPRLLEKGCVAARRVTHSALRAASNVDAVLQACGALTGGRSSSDACGEAQQKLRDAYALLAAEKGNEAGHMAADAVRLLRVRCPKMRWLRLRRWKHCRASVPRAISSLSRPPSSGSRIFSSRRTRLTDSPQEI